MDVLIVIGLLVVANVLMILYATWYDGCPSRIGRTGVPGPPLVCALSRYHRGKHIGTLMDAFEHALAIVQWGKSKRYQHGVSGLIAPKNAASVEVTEGRVVRT